MLSTIFMTLAAVLSTSAQYTYTPSNDTYLLAKLIPILSPVNNYMFDGSPEITQCKTSTRTIKPSLQQMMYYNYYSAAMYCQYYLNDLSCVFCEKFRNDVGAHTVLMNNYTDTTALVTIAHNRKEIVVTYRGTAALWNVVLSALFVSIQYGDNTSDIKLHKGFYYATMSLYNEVVKHVTYLRILHSNYKLVFAGHSLGGAMARITLFFLLYLKQFPGCTYELYTYGEPRVGNKAFADFMNNQTITTARAVARADIIPHAYPVSIANNDYYIHTQTEFWINGQGDQKFCNQSIYEDPTCSNSMGPAYSALDHILYFDANYALCYVQAAQFLAIPANIFQPVGTIPPLPQRITDIFSVAANFVGDVVGPILGR